MYEESEVGPLRWMPPESIFKSQFSIKSDVYAYGITIIEILTKKQPFHKLDNTSFVEAISTGTISPVDELPSDVSEEIRFLVKACTEKDAHLRPNFEQITDILDNPSFKL